MAGNAKADPALRASAADALYMTGDPRAAPALLEIARSGYVTVGGQKASDLRANAAIDFARLAGPEHFAAFKALADKETEVQGVFGEALDRLQVAKECKADLACYGKALQDPSWPRAEKAAFALGLLRATRRPCRCCWAALHPLLTLSQDRYPVHQAMLFALVRLADKTCKDVRGEARASRSSATRRRSACPAPAACWPRPGWRWPRSRTPSPGARATAATLADRSDPAPAARRQGQAGQGRQEAALAAALDADCYFLTCSTTTVVWMPPRTLKSPSTRARRGSMAATRSSRIRLVTASWKAPSLRYDQR